MITLVHAKQHLSQLSSRHKCNWHLKNDTKDYMIIIKMESLSIRIPFGIYIMMEIYSSILHSDSSLIRYKDYSDLGLISNKLTKTKKPEDLQCDSGWATVIKHCNFHALLSYEVTSCFSKRCFELLSSCFVQNLTHIKNHATSNCFSPNGREY